jgi:hypothetical protein
MINAHHDGDRVAGPRWLRTCCLISLLVIACTPQSAAPRPARWNRREVEELAARLGKERLGNTQEEFVARLRHGSPRPFGPALKYLHCLGSSCSESRTYMLNSTCWLATVVNWEGAQSARRLEAAEVRCGRRTLAYAEAARHPNPV